ncbi:hypothetical protein [Thermoproteus sp. CP80]|uniref:hypothetical protein n=1 Tax=Thermoproteus sp. CP80 TaxID=1650659 RepID=UPI00117EEBAF|nr:hypothetical protein [Thermoproteus sp. CP80]
MEAAVESGEEYLAFINESPAALPMYYAVPLSYQAENFLVACTMYDWRSSTAVNGSLELAPGKEWWAAAYPMGDSKVAEAVVAAKADMFRYVFGAPPPPPPANLSGFVRQWRIPWDNRTLPYKPYYSPGMRMPPRDNSTGIPLWSIQNLEDVQITQGNIVGWLFTVLFVTVLSIAAVFEFLGALFDFPTPAREVWGFVTGVIQDWTYWLPIRVAVRGRLFTRIWRAVKRPVMRQTVRIAARAHALAASRIPALRYIRSSDLKEYYREYVKRRRDIAFKDPAEQIREEINVKWRREALERVLRAMEERADVEWMRNLERRREEERRRMLEAARRVWNALKADNIVEVVRELSPRFDIWLQERVEMSRGSLSYHLFWWRLDRLPFMWRSLLRLDPHVIARLEAEGRIKPEEAEALRNLRAAVEAYAAELRWGWARLHSVPQYVKAAEEEFEKARQRMAQEAEKGLADFRRFIADFERRYEALRRYFSEPSGLDEGERDKAAGEAKKAVERLEEALRHFAVIDRSPRARLVSALNEALRHIAEGRAPQIPRDASVEDIVKGLALMDLGLAVRALRSAERYLEAHYAVAPTRYDARQIAAEIVRWHIEERIPTLKLAGLARGVVLGARGAEEGEIALRSWSGRTAARRVEEAPWEAVAHRASLLREQRANAAEVVRIRPDVVLTADYARYLAGFRVGEEALEALRKAVEYRRVLHVLERAEELRMPPTAVERLAAEAERLRQEVLRETSQIYRRFGEEFFFVKDIVEGRRVVRREVPEVREVVRAFEDALAEALKAPERRERAFRELFTEGVERLAEERAKRGDVEGAERVRRAAAELAKASEKIGWRAVEDVSVVLPAVAKAFEEAYAETKSPSELARAFKARAEEAARRFEQQGMEDVAARIRRAAERIAGEVGDRASVERMRALLSPEHAGRAIEGLELLRRLLSSRAALDAYRSQRGEAGKAAAELDKARRVAEELGLKNVVEALEKPDGKRIAKALGELERELARLYGALELAEYVRRPRADAEFGHAWAVARMLGLEEVDRLFRALSEVSLFELREGREAFRNPLYDEVKHLIDEERVRALVRAPLYSYVVDRLGPDVLRPTYARWYGLFADYGSYLATAFEHSRTSAAKAGAPLGLTGGFSYARKMMGWLGDFGREAVARGLKAYYKGEGRPFRELGEMTIRGAKVQLYEKAAELARARAEQLISQAGGEAAEGLRLLAAVLRAKAAYEEIRLVQTYLRGAERRAEALLREAKSACCIEAQLELERRAREGLEAAREKAERYLADARARYRAHVAEIRGFVKERGDIREVAARYFGLTARAFTGDPQGVAERMARAVDVRRVVSWADELARELGEMAVRVVDAERIYAKFEKVLKAKAEPIPPAYDLEKAQHFFAESARPQPPPRSRLEEAVPRAVRDVFAAYYAKLRDAAERASVYLALMRGDGRFAKREVERARQALLRALRAGSREEALAALEDLKKALKALGIDVEGNAPEAFVKAVEERARPAYEEYLNARREYAAAVDAIAKFSPEAALALGEMAREGGPDPIARWMALTAYEARERALREYARHWARPLEERWDSLPQPVREIIARREDEAAGEVLRRALRSAGIIVKRDAAADLAALEDALAKVFTANGEWGDLGERVRQAVEVARRVQRGEASTDELARAVDALLAAYGARAAERFVESDRLEDAVGEMHEAMRRYARNSGLRIGREAAERALLLGLSAVPQEHVEAYMRGGWRGRIEPYVAYWTEDEGLARRAGEAGWEVRQIKRPASFEEGVPKEWRTAYVVAPRGLDLSAVERAVTELVDDAREGLAYIRPAEWPAPEPFIWFVLKDRQPARDGDQIAAYSIDRLSIEEPLSRFGEALRARDHDGARKAVGELYDARLNRTVWQIVYEFDRPRARDALEYLRRRYGEPEERLWERHDELYLTWLAFRLADEYADYLRSGAGRELRTKEEAAGVIFMPWLLQELTPAFMHRLVGDEEGWGEFRAVWITALNMWFEGMAEPYQPKKPAAARRALELFNAFMGAKFTYEELFPPPPPKPEAVRPEAQRLEAAKPAEAKRLEALKPAEAVNPAEVLRPAEAEPAERPAAEVQKPAVEERGLRREAVERPAAKPEAVEPAARLEAAGEVRGLRLVELGERPRAPAADVIPERAFEAVEYLVERFGAVLDKEAAFKAEGFVIAKVKARIERVARREPEFAHILGEVAEDVLRSLGRLMASPDAARHAHDALFYLFEGYATRDGERLYARIEPAIREAVRRAEEAGVPDAEYRVKQFVLEILDVLARAGERYRRDALKGISTVERALRATAFAGLSAAAAYSAYHGLYSDAVVSSVASAIALADAGQFREAAEYVRRAAKALYEAARDVFERARVAAERLAELFVEAVTRVLAWIDEHKAYLFLAAAVAVGLIALSAAMNLWGLIELGRLAHAAAGLPLFVGLAETGGRAAERFRALAERYMRWRIGEEAVDGILKAPQRGERPYRALLRLAESGSLPRPLAELRRALDKVEDEAEKDAAVVAALALYRALVKNAEAYKEWGELYRWARGLAERQEFTVKAEEVRRLREAHGRLEEAAEELRRELNGVLALYSWRRDVYERLRPHLEVDLKRAEGLAEASYKGLSDYSDASMGTKAYAALLSIARGGIYGHVAMLLAVEGALADIVISTPGGAYNKAKDIAGNRGEAVDPSRSPKGAAVWEDRAASALLRYLLGRAVDEDLGFRRVGEGFEVFRAYGGVEARVDTLKIGKTAASSKAGEEESRRFVEEAKGMAPDLSGIRKIWQTMPWLATDVSFSGGRIVAGTAHPWQLAWYIALLGEPESSKGGASVTEEGIKLNVTAYWPREVLDRIIAGESKELEPLLGRPVKGWRELVDAVGWSQVLERVGELADELKPWIGRKDAKDAEREDLARRMLGELALFAHFAEARRGLDDGEWRKERAERLSRAVEALSGGRIGGEYAERLAKLIIYYAESRKKEIEERIEDLAKELASALKEDAGRIREEVWSVVDFALSDMGCLARDCARDEVARKFVEPALELIMLEKALRGWFNRGEALLRFGEMYATAIAGDGSVESRRVELVVGGELGGGAALLRLATLHLINDLLPGELRFGVHTHVKEGRYYRIAVYGDDAARLMRLLAAAAAPSAGGGYLSPKFEEFMEAAKVEVRLDEGSIRQTEGGRVADLVISEGGADVKFNVYLREDAIVLQFKSSDRGRAELAALLLKLAGVSAEVKKEGGRNMWYVRATTDKLAAGRRELRDALAEVVRKAAESGWVNRETADRWLDKLERGLTLREGWPKYGVWLARSGTLVIRYRSINPDNIEREVQRLKAMGLEEGVHFAVRMPKGGRKGYVYILREGLERAAWLSEHGSEGQRELAAEFIGYILKRAEKEGGAVYKKALEVVRRGREVGSLRLADVRGAEVFVGGKRYVVDVIGGGAQPERSGSGKTLLRITIAADIDGVRGEYTITFGRYGRNNAAMGFAIARADAPGGREADAERFSALIKALTGREPKMYRRSDGKIMMVCYEGHLEGLARYAELADAIRRWLKETGRR